MPRITSESLHNLVERINENLSEPDMIALDGDRSRDGARIWKIGKLGQSFQEMGGPELTTTQMYYLLLGYLSRVEGETNVAGSWDAQLSPAAAGGTGVRHYRAYISEQDPDRVILYDMMNQAALSIENNDLEPGHYVMEVRSGTGGENITSYRAALPDPDVDLEELEPTESELTIPKLNADGSGIFYPQPDMTFIISRDQEMIFDHLFNIGQYVPQKLLISGPPGTGKTEGAREYAARKGYGVFQISCGQVESPAEWFGGRRVVIDPESGQPVTIFEKSAFIRAVETPNTLIILDEYNRLHSSLQNSLYNLLDDTGMAWIDHELKCYVRPAAGVIFVATANIGSQHTGTFVIDAAMADRFSYHLRMTYLSPSYEESVLVQRTGVDKDIANKLVSFAGKTRELAFDEDNDSPISEGVSFRQLLKASEAIACGMDPVQAAQFTIFSRYSEDGGSESPLAAVKEIFQGKFGRS